MLSDESDEEVVEAEVPVRLARRHPILTLDPDADLNQVPAPVSHDLTSDAAVSAAREAFACDPGAAHGVVACEELHWYHAGRQAWLTRHSGAWVGWDAAGAECALPVAEVWTPWTIAFDGARAPFFTWFAGAQTNAAFNECDRHVLAGHGGTTARKSGLASPATARRGLAWCRQTLGRLNASAATGRRATAAQARLSPPQRRGFPLSNGRLRKGFCHRPA